MGANLPFSIHLRRGEPVTQQVVFAVTRAVTTGQLRPGDSFPSVRTLSQELHVNPNTAHRIVTLLVDEGILSVVTGIGTVISESAAVGRPAELESGLERIVVEARRAGWALQHMLARIRDHWARTERQVS